MVRGVTPHNYHGQSWYFIQIHPQLKKNKIRIVSSRISHTSADNLKHLKNKKTAENHPTRYFPILSGICAVFNLASKAIINQIYTAIYWYVIGQKSKYSANHVNVWAQLHIRLFGSGSILNAMGADQYR